MLSLKNRLLKKINNKTSIVGVIGLGYVGIPLAMEIAKARYKTIGFDIEEEKIKAISKGNIYIKDIDKNELRSLIDSNLFKATLDFSFLKNVDIIFICVPTPLDICKQPDLSYVISSAKSIAKYIKLGALVILESTTYPGTTQELLRPILEERGLKCGEDFFLAFSPERVDPGNKHFNTKNTPKVVGGCTEECTEVAAALYENVLEGKIHRVSSPAVAEMEKILENTFRNINIGLANEMAILCNRMGIDVWEVIDAAKTKPYGFMPFYPGPGIGGHCIPLDPFYLEWKAREYDYHTKLIETSGIINDSMPDFVLENIMKILNKEKKALNGSKVLVMGLAYKNDIDDYRESPSFKVIELLEKNGAEVIVNDPFCDTAKYKGKTYHSVDWKEVIDETDIVVITTGHTVYNYEEIVDRAKVVYDTRNSTKNVVNNREKIYKL